MTMREAGCHKNHATHDDEGGGGVIRNMSLSVTMRKEGCQSNRFTYDEVL